MYLLNSSTMCRVWHKVNFWAELQSFFIFKTYGQTKAKEHSLPYYFSIEKR